MDFFCIRKIFVINLIHRAASPTEAIFFKINHSMQLDVTFSQLLFARGNKQTNNEFLKNN